MEIELDDLRKKVEELEADRSESDDTEEDCHLAEPREAAN